MLDAVLKPRDLAVLTPAVLCAEPGSAAATLTARAGRDRWPTVVCHQVTSAVHAASVRDTRLVLVGGNTFTWVHQAVRELRLAGSFPIALVATDLSYDEGLALLDRGASLVIERQATAREMAARLTALCRGSGADDEVSVRWLHSGRMRLDLRARRCLLDDEPVALSQNEFDLLAFLMSHALQVMPQQDIVQRVWGWRHGDGANTLRIHVGRLRRKLGDTPTEPTWIGSVRGTGYQFLQPVAELGDDRSDERLRQSVSLLNAHADALGALVDTLLAAPDVTSVAESVVQWAVARGFSDAATVFRLDAAAAVSRLVASAGMSARWRQSIATGHPVSAGFMGSQVYRSGESVQLHDMSRLARRFPVTARMASTEDLHACLLFPITVAGRVWGDLAFVSRTARAFNPARAAYLRTVAGVVSLALAGRPDGDA
ncbi:winged helix-turn-helix domain-containing protein [Phytohabitans sp. ZYX-F-186]|uniref:Winged helix-turn-helix domain-containing protein n=1 Tax=Phytohabitans maris TaxID=3071409 RepID=A0ABU0ZSJ0_9ACTN|nr:winged helix-turn-helix domain-containing protein [Phytohabitans sp. ZYX-F-186]MDQ7909972.1 winged helix-turn-helix domain-containing protein [Phytohabitans sp. ZYX-F-186]